MDKRPTIKCSLCDKYFVEGREYREHWEELIIKIYDNNKKKSRPYNGYANL